ncbi:MAG: peroxide stress protein YaaA [Bacteroidota bacterium]|nr:peroxide stress protein YaaA [Bacteroidota bacterium]
MIIVISPSKTLNFKPAPSEIPHTQPAYTSKSQELINTLRSFSPKDLASLFKVSSAIAELNFERYATWHLPFTPKNAKQSILAFKGEVYNGLKAETFDAADLAFAQDHLRILSGLYGLLRPLDLIQPYRLEMGTHLKTSKAKNLYLFWNHLITQNLNKELSTESKPVLINLASAEYFKAINTQLLKARVITPEFREHKNGKYEMIGVYAKKARGLMSRFTILNRLTDPEDLKAFDDEGYHFNPHLSQNDTWVFSRG